MEDRDVGMCRCRQLLGGVVKYWEVWSIYCGLISNTVGLSVVKNFMLASEKMSKTCNID